MTLQQDGRVGVGVGAGSHMAHLVKWWKARFLNGYRQFSVGQQDCHDGRASDTEELLRRPEAERSPSPEEPEREPEREPEPEPEPEPERERTPSQERAARRERLPSPGPERRHHLNFEEFECDVSVEGGVDEAGQERQEFSFTLYDFDGHGKITKDDITGLVSTIYETLGASIKVPHYGSKTIKVKLTVSPDKRCRGASGPGAHSGGACSAGGAPGAAAGSPGSAGAAAGAGSAPRVRFKRDLNVTIQERRPLPLPRGRPRRTASVGASSQPHGLRRRPSAREQREQREPSEDRGYVVHSCSSSCRSGAGSDGGDVSADDEDIEDDEEEVDVPRRTSRLSPSSVAAAAATAATVASAACSGVGSGQGHEQIKKRSSSMQRQELLKIIQANMEKNNLCFQTSKKSCGEGRGERTGLEERRHSHSGVHPHHRHRQKHKVSSLSASASPQRIYDYATTPYYVNVAEKGDTAAGDADTYRYVLCSPKHAPMYHNLPYRDRGHHRSRSHDLSANTHAHNHAHSHAHNHSHSHSHSPAAPLFRYTLLQEDATSSVQAFNVKPPRATGNAAAAAAAAVAAAAHSPACNRRTRLPTAAVGHTSSPHHLKHRNREQDQARAMAQVVQWLEQEFSASLNTKNTGGVQEVLLNAKAHRTKTKSAAFNAPPDVPTSTPAPPVSSNSPSRPPPVDDVHSSPKQHEHHHVHEHIHHHYHHYQETPPVLV